MDGGYGGATGATANGNWIGGTDGGGWAGDEAGNNGPPEHEEAPAEDEAGAEGAVAGNGSTRVEAGSGTVAA